MRSPSRNRITPSFSARSDSNRARSVPRKYVSKSAYIASRCSWVVRFTTDPVSRRSTSKCCDVDVSGAMIELLMSDTSVRPRSEIEPAGIGVMAIRARHLQQRIAGIETDQEIVESTLAREVVDFAKQLAEDFRICCADQG